MDAIEHIRRKRLRELVGQYRTQAEFADAIGSAPNYVSRMLSGSKKIGEKMARRIERRLGLPHHSMDTDGSLPTERQPTLSVDALDIAMKWERLSPPLRAQITSLIHTLLELQGKGRKAA